MMTSFRSNSENLGLHGVLIENSVYTLKMRMDESCKVTSRTKLSSEAAKSFMVISDDEYYPGASYLLYGILDNLHVAVPRQRRGGS
ncbi:unnamed protein product [Musa hybrid cultivar]